MDGITWYCLYYSFRSQELFEKIIPKYSENEKKQNKKTYSENTFCIGKKKIPKIKKAQKKITKKNSYPMEYKKIYKIILKTKEKIRVE